MNTLEYIRTLCTLGGHAALYQAVPPIYEHTYVVILASDVVVEGLPFARTTMYAASPQGEFVHSDYLYRILGYDHTDLAEELGYVICSRSAFVQSKTTTARTSCLDRTISRRGSTRDALGG